MHRELILGGPGCGKTTSLLELVEGFLRQGIQPNEIGYLAFTRRAAGEALDRASSLFSIKSDDFQFFRTLHSMAFKELGLTREHLMTESHYDELGDMLKVKFGGVEDEFGMISEQRERGSQYYHIEQQARLRMISVRDMALVDGRQSYWLVQHYQDSLVNYKMSRKIFDYTDILERWLEKMQPVPLKVLIVDEAQDLSPLQWKIIHKLESTIPFVYYAGDDDQAIYSWAGADVNHFLSLSAARRELPISYRIPSEIHTRCRRIASRIRRRYEKTWHSADRKGQVAVVSSPELAPLNEGEWMILARNHYHLDSIASFLRAKGVLFHFKGKSSLSSADALAVRAWRRAQLSELVSVADIRRIISKVPKHACSETTSSIFAMDEDQVVPREVLKEYYGINLDRNWEDVLSLRPHEKAYIRMVQTREPNLDANPRVKISTIHAVKGGESDNVLLLPDMSSACYESFLKNPDDESRVFYVGASRAKERLVICQPQASNYFPL